MPVAVFIASVDRTEQTRVPATVEVEYNLGAPARASVEILDPDSFETAYRPDLDELLAIHDGDAIFAGDIWGVEDRPLGDPGVGTVTRCQAVNIWRVAGQRRVYQIFAAGFTLKAVIQTIITNYLTEFSIILDMDDGPTMGELTFDYVTAEDAFARLVDLTQWIYRLTPGSVLEWFEIGDKDQGITFSAENNNILGAIRWSRSRQIYVNSVIVRYGSGVVAQVDNWVGDGTTVSFPITYPLASAGWVTYIGGPYPSPGGHEGVGTSASTDQPWYIDTVTNSLVRNVGAAIPGGAAAAPAVGDAIQLEYMVQYPLTVIVDDPVDIALHGTIDTLVEAAEIFEEAAAITLGEAQLRKHHPTPRTIELRTHEAAASHFLPGDTVGVDVPARTLALSIWLIVAVRVVSDETQEYVTTLTLLEGDEAQESWIDFWRNAFGLGRGSSGGIISGSTLPPPAGGTGSGTPGPPNTAVQFNDNGLFGGDAAFTYNKATKSLAMGTGSSIDEPNADSCGAFGDDCHIG